MKLNNLSQQKIMQNIITNYKSFMESDLTSEEKIVLYEKIQHWIVMARVKLQEINVVYYIVNDDLKIISQIIKE